MSKPGVLLHARLAAPYVVNEASLADVVVEPRVVFGLAEDSLRSTLAAGITLVVMVATDDELPNIIHLIDER